MQNSAQHVLFDELPAKLGRVGLIILNRPKALNALSEQMLIDITNKLNLWKLDPNINVIVVKSACTKAFSAGGDIKHVYNAIINNTLREPEYFAIEYRLSQLIHEYPKPYIALIDGIAMGGGLALAVHGTHTIASEKLTLAMPETALGLYPDAGGTYFLGHCPNYLGMYLGITGVSIGVDDAIFCELIDAYIPSESQLLFLQELLKQDVTDNPIAAVDKLIAKYQKNPKASALAKVLKTLQQCFAQKSIEDIIQALEQADNPWAKEQLEVIKTRSPLSLKITHRAIALGKDQGLSQCLEREYNLTLSLLKSHDLREGIRAVLIDKTRDPKWQPATLDEITPQRLDQIFEIRCKL